MSGEESARREKTERGLRLPGVQPSQNTNTNTSIDTDTNTNTPERALTPTLHFRGPTIFWSIAGVLFSF